MTIEKSNNDETTAAEKNANAATELSTAISTAFATNENAIPTIVSMQR